MDRIKKIIEGLLSRINERRIILGLAKGEHGLWRYGKINANNSISFNEISNDYSLMICETENSAGAARIIAPYTSCSRIEIFLKGALTALDQNYASGYFPT